MPSETQIQSCPVCGRAIASAMPEGLCPACLALQVLGGTRDVPFKEGRQKHPLMGLRFFGDYELLEEIGRGGMGIVFRAQQLGVNRIVALKVLTGGAAAGRQFVHRFHTEAAAAASLNHPHIVPIYEFGEHEGAHFLAMRFMEGGTLQTRAHRAPSPAEAARLVITIAESIQYAHGHGVLHRDLKPGNILIDKEGQPFVGDFGLARVLIDDSDLTVSNAVLGTAPYLAPEVAARGAGAATTSSDIYGLGAILYELLARRAPFTGATIGEVLRKVQETEPEPPSEAIDESKSNFRQTSERAGEFCGKEAKHSEHMGSSVRIPRDLETICLKCLEKEPEKRYSTAQALADDLNRFLRNEPILARPAGPTERLWRWCRRKPVTAGLVAALNLAFAIGLAGILWEWSRAAAGELNARQHQYVSDMNLAQQVWEEGNVKRAGDLLRAHTPKRGESDLRGFEWRYLWKLCEQDDSRYAFTNFGDSLSDLAYSPDGKVLAVAQSHAIRLLDVPSRRELAEVTDPDTNDFIYRVVWSPRATNILATGGSRGVVKLWNVASREVSVLAYHPSERERSQIGGIAFSPDGTMLAVASNNSGWTVGVWDVEQNKQIWATNTAIPPRAVAFSRDGKALVTGGGENGNGRVWNARTGEELPPFPRLHSGWINRIAVSPDGRTLATRGNDSRIILWDFPERRRKLTLACPGPDCVVFSPDGRLVASVGFYGIVRVWDAASGEQKALLRGHSGSVTALAFAPDGGDIVSAGEDRTVRVWNLAPSPDRDLLVPRDQNQCVNALTFSPDGKKLVTGSLHRNWAELWDVPSRQPITNLDGQTWSAVFSPDGKLLVTGDLQAGPAVSLGSAPEPVGFDKTVRLWNAETLQLVCLLTNEFYPSSIAFSPESKTLVVGYFSTLAPDGSRTLAIWDVASRRKLERLAPAAPNAGPLALSNDGRLLVIGYVDGWVRLWDFRTGRKLDEYRKTASPIWAVAFSRNGAQMASGSDGSSEVFLYDVASRRVSLLEGHASGVLSVVFSPDCKTLASASDDGTIKLWNLATHEVALTLRRQIGPIYSVAFTRDGNLLASGGSDGDVRLWPAASFDEMIQTEMEQK